MFNQNVTDMQILTSYELEYSKIRNGIIYQKLNLKLKFSSRQATYMMN